uniref:FYVE-type domain-containing protein n=1 Tax=Kalanchoe fedtschenkoi TaxID=63787 RepID=A0A7N1A2A5_KALFE
MQQGQYNYYAHLHQPPFQNPNPTDPSIASAPPISPSYASSGFPDNYASGYPQNYDPAPADPAGNPSRLDSMNQFQQVNSYPHQPALQHTHNYSFGQQDSTAAGGPHSFDPYPSSYAQIGGSVFMPNYGSSQEYSGAGGVGRSYDSNYSSQYDNSRVYAYNGGRTEAYDTQGRGGSSTSVAFDDYGRPINLSPERSNGGGARTLGDIMKAAPKADDHAQTALSKGAQKFRVTLLAESGGQTSMDVLCQVGLDGIRMLDPTTSRVLRVYPLETVAKWEVLDSNIFAFWSQSSTDFESRRIRLKSNSYTTNTILDAVTASAFQFKEMAPLTKSADMSKMSEQAMEKKKGLVDWMNLVRLKNEEKDYWVPDEAVSKCMACGTDFGAFVRKHHCRNCGDIFCDKCSQGRIALTADEEALPVRVCDRCMAEVTQRLSNGPNTGDKVSDARSHEDLMKELQEEMDRKRQASSGSKAAAVVTNLREVACPTCTVHLKVELPVSGSKTVKCNVCQHLFLVNAA